MGPLVRAQDSPTSTPGVVFECDYRVTVRYSVYNFIESPTTTTPRFRIYGVAQLRDDAKTNYIFVSVCTLYMYNIKYTFHSSCIHGGDDEDVACEKPRARESGNVCVKGT